MVIVWSSGEGKNRRALARQSVMPFYRPVDHQGDLNDLEASLHQREWVDMSHTLMGIQLPSK